MLGPNFLSLLSKIMWRGMTANNSDIACMWVRSDICIINPLSYICGRHKWCQCYATHHSIGVTNCLMLWSKQRHFWQLCLQGQNVSLLSNSLLCADSFCSQECQVSRPSLTGTNNSTSECTLTWSSNWKYTRWTDRQAFQEHFGFIRKYLATIYCKQ